MKINIVTSELVPKDTILIIEPKMGKCPHCGYTDKQDVCKQCFWPGGMIRAIITNLKVPEEY